MCYTAKCANCKISTYKCRKCINIWWYPSQIIHTWTCNPKNRQENMPRIANQKTGSLKTTTTSTNYMPLCQRAYQLIDASTIPEVDREIISSEIKCPEHKFHKSLQRCVTAKCPNISTESQSLNLNTVGRSLLRPLRPKKKKQGGQERRTSKPIYTSEHSILKKADKKICTILWNVANEKTKSLNTASKKNHMLFSHCANEHIN